MFGHIVPPFYVIFFSNYIINRTDCCAPFILFLNVLLIWLMMLRLVFIYLFI